MTKADEAINKLCKSLGTDYMIKTIDGEPCVYRDFSNGFNVEISGMYTANMKTPGEPISLAGQYPHRGLRSGCSAGGYRHCCRKAPNVCGRSYRRRIRRG